MCASHKILQDWILPGRSNMSDELILIFFISLLCVSSDHNNRTALHVAAMRGSKRCVECILQYHPQSINLLDKNQVCKPTQYNNLELWSWCKEHSSSVINRYPAIHVISCVGN